MRDFCSCLICVTSSGVTARRSVLNLFCQESSSNFFKNTKLIMAAGATGDHSSLTDRCGFDAHGAFFGFSFFNSADKTISSTKTLIFIIQFHLMFTGKQTVWRAFFFFAKLRKFTSSPASGLNTRKKEPHGAWWHVRAEKLGLILRSVD